PLGHVVAQSQVPVAAMDALFRQSGVIRVDTLAEMFDVAQVLAYQPLPAGRRVGVAGNSDAVTLLAVDAATSAGLRAAGEPRNLRPDASAADFERAVQDLLADSAVDAIIVVFVPTVESSRDDEVARILAAAVKDADKPVVATFLGTRGVPEALRIPGEGGAAARGSIPSYPSGEEAARALAHAAAYGEWRRRPRGRVPDVDGCDAEAAAALAAEALRRNPAGGRLEGDMAQR